MFTIIKLCVQLKHAIASIQTGHVLNGAFIMVTGQLNGGTTCQHNFSTLLTPVLIQ